MLNEMTLEQRSVRRDLHNLMPNLKDIITFLYISVYHIYKNSYILKIFLLLPGGANLMFL